MSTLIIKQWYMFFLVNSVRYRELVNPKLWVIGVIERIQLEDKSAKM